MKEKFRNEPELQGTPPPSGHRQRFLEKLEQPEQKKGKVRWLTIFASAAAAAVVAFAVVFWQNDSQDDPQLAENQQGQFDAFEQLNGRSQKLEVVFATHVKPQLGGIIEKQPELQKQVAFLEELEKEYSRLKSLLAASEGQQQITQEMIRNHRMRLRVMDNLLLQLEALNISNNQKNEKSSI